MEAPIYHLEGVVKAKEENMEDIHITTLPADKSPAKRKP